MKNQVGREIPDEILARMGKTGYRGLHDRDNASYRKASPTVRALNDPQRGKLCASLREALEKCELRDGMYFGFHHHFRDGDYVINMVMQEVARMGIRDITICATSMGAAHDALEPLIKQGVIAGIQSSGVRGKIGEAISKGKFKKPAIIRSHGGRVRAIEEGDIHLDVAFIGAPTADEYGNARAVGGKSDCGVLSYSMADAKYADRVVVITPYFKDGFSFQTGGGGAALAVNGMLKPYMQQKGIRMGFAIGGIMQAMCDLMDEGFVRKIVDAQVFDAAAIEHIKTNPNHVEISTSEYANPMNKGAYVNKLDFVILGALEVDVDFNVNVVTGSDGVVRGAPGGHPDTAAGAKCAIVVAPLIRSRIPTIVDRVLTVTTPGEAIDVVVTDCGIAINPRRQDLIAAYQNSGLPICTIEALRDEAYRIAGKPDPVEFEDEVVAVVESRDGSILDVIRKIRE